jgi:hypothetical protein
VPWRIRWEAEGPVVDWCYAGDTRFEEPFFEQTIRRVLRDPAKRAACVQTPLATLEEVARQFPGLAPSGFIFHMSRCGSTLAARLLGTLPGCAIVSEAPPIDALLRANERDPRIGDEQRASWLRSIVSVLGGRRRGDERTCVVKLDAWHTLQLPLIERAFPDVPWVFLYREPLEVLFSHQAQPSLMMSGFLEPGLLGLEPAAAVCLPREEYHARVLARVCEAALEYGARGAFVDYRELPGAVWEWIAASFGIEVSEAERGAMREAASFGAKTPAERFTPDGERKREAASDAVRLAARRLGSLYERLGAAAQSQRGTESR